MDVFALVGILALSFAVGLLATWAVLKLVMVVMMRHRTPAYFEPQPVALSTNSFTSVTTRGAR